MKFQGTELKALATGTVKIPRPGNTFLEFKVRATSLGDETKGERFFPDQRPPMEFSLDPKGLPARDPVTDKLLPREPNFFNPNYVTRQEEAARMQMVVLVVDALAEDPNVTWSTTKGPGTRDYYVDCFEEMKAAGITVGDMRCVLRCTRELGNLDAKALERAAESFS